MAPPVRAAQHAQQHQNPPPQLPPPHPQQGIVGLTSSFEGLSVGTHSTHPPMMHHPHHHHAQMSHHPLAHHPHAHPPQLPGPPHAQSQHPHAHPHLHPPPGQQPHQPHPMAQPPHIIQQHTQPTTMQMWVPQDRVGAVIGSQGTVIKALQDRSRATIQVHNDTIRGDRKLFTIVGGPAECSLARQLVTEIIDRPRSGQHHSHNHGGSSIGSQSPNHQAGGQRDRNSYHHAQDQADSGNRLSKTVYVPTSCVGLVIGRRGETIRDLQQKSGASILVTRDRDAAQGSQERSVLISGTEQAIVAAHLLVSQIVREAYVRRNAQGHGPNHSGGPPGAHGPTLVETLTVPDDKVGLIIGKGGSAIRELQSMSGAKIQVAKEDEASSSSNTRPVTITGVRNCIETAKSLIAEKVNMHLPPSAPLQTFSPQQPTYAPANPGIYFPIYEPGFGHPMQGAYQHVPPQAGYDPADQQAQMRASLAYYQYYGYAAAAHQQHMMQYQNHDHHRQHQHGQGIPHQQHGQTGVEAPDQPDQDGPVDQQNVQGTPTDSTGDVTQGQSQTEPATSSAHVQQQQQTIQNHIPHAQRNSFGMQDQRGLVPAVGGQSQPLPHIARQQMHVQQQQQMQRVSHQMPQHIAPRGRMMPQHHGHMQHGHMHPQAAQQARAHHAQIQAQMQAAHMHHMRAAQAHAQAQAQQVQAQQSQSQSTLQTQGGGQDNSSRASGTTVVPQRELTQRGGNTTGDDTLQK